jgi:hypothetical protein
MSNLNKAPAIPTVVMGRPNVEHVSIFKYLGALFLEGLGHTPNMLYSVEERFQCMVSNIQIQSPACAGAIDDGKLVCLLRLVGTH